MRKLIVCAILFCCALQSPAQEKYLAKEDFEKKVNASLPSIKQFRFLDSAFNYIESVFNIPLPMYKARVIAEENNDTIYFYYYPGNHFDTVLRSLLSYRFTKDSMQVDFTIPFSDSAMNSLLVYFHPPVKNPKATYSPALDDGIKSSFGFDQLKMTYDVKVEKVEKDEPPPPPPPPPPPKKRKRNQ